MVLSLFVVQEWRQSVLLCHPGEVQGEEGQRRRSLGRGHRRPLPLPRHRGRSGYSVMILYDATAN
jgi:hypothetical protein